MAVVHGPEHLSQILGTLPDGVRLQSSIPRTTVDLVIVFVTKRSTLARDFPRLVATLPPDGVLWVAWPKKASKVPTDMSDHAIREIALPRGWVDTKVCAIDATWSGLKLVVRRQHRP